MRIILFTFFLFVITSDLNGQSEKIIYKTISNKFENFYNTENYDSIYALFSVEMKKALPNDKTIEFLSGLHSQAGKITKRQFVKYLASYASYKTNFERALFSLNISLNSNAEINGLFIKPFTDENLPKLERNISKLILPFNGEWTIVWGGDTKELNYHVENVAQKNAFDILIMDSTGKSYKTNGQVNEDYYAFGQDLYAPCEGEIVLVVDGIKDNKPGNLNPIYLPGNSVIIKTPNREYLIFAHFKQHSIKVAQGQKIKKGQLLGLCGNSGNSSEPHLHFHIQNVEDMNIATGVKCYFDQIIVNGQLKKDYSPIKGDKIKNF